MENSIPYGTFGYLPSDAHGRWSVSGRLVMVESMFVALKEWRKSQSVSSIVLVCTF